LLFCSSIAYDASDDDIAEECNINLDWTITFLIRYEEPTRSYIWLCRQ